MGCGTANRAEGDAVVAAPHKPQPPKVQSPPPEVTPPAPAPETVTAGCPSSVEVPVERLSEAKPKEEPIPEPEAEPECKYSLIVRNSSIVPSVQRMVDLDFHLYADSNFSRKTPATPRTEAVAVVAAAPEKRPEKSPLLLAINRLRQEPQSFLEGVRAEGQLTQKQMQTLEGRIAQFWRKGLGEIRQSEILTRGCETFAADVAEKGGVGSVAACFPMEDRIREHGCWLGECGSFVWDLDGRLCSLSSLANGALVSPEDPDEVSLLFSPTFRFAGVAARDGTTAWFMAEDVVTTEEKRRADRTLEGVKRGITPMISQELERLVEFRWSLRFVGRGVTVSTVTRVRSIKGGETKERREEKTYPLYGD